MKIKFGYVRFIILLSVFLFFVITTKYFQAAPFEGKIKVTGHSQYLGYLNAGLDIFRRGVPVKGLKVYLNELLLNEHSGGFYSNGTPYHYNVVVGNEIVIKFIPKKTIRRFRERVKPVVIGVYRINNKIEWVYPRPNSVISLGRRMLRSRYIIFSWNYVGRTLKTKVTLENFTKHKKIFSTIITGEEVSIPTNLLIRGNRYRFDLEVVGPMGYFRLTPVTERGSKIAFYYWDHIYFNVK